MHQTATFERRSHGKIVKIGANWALWMGLLTHLMLGWLYEVDIWRQPAYLDYPGWGRNADLTRVPPGCRSFRVFLLQINSGF